jgi:formylglycine-generating enzyme required for sulfatase activity
MSRLSRMLPALPIAVLGLFVLSLTAREDKPKGKKYAFLVGVKSYDHAKLADLKYTENDIAELAEVLSAKSAGFTSVRVLTTTRGKKKAADKPTAKNIRAGLKALLDKKTKHDTVLVALAGHGLRLKVDDPRDKRVERYEAFFCPSDAHIKKPSTMISFRDLYSALDESGAGVKLLLADAARNDPRAMGSIDVDEMPRPPRGLSALFSCASGQRSYESAKLGKGHGVFFHYVLEGLRGKAKDEDGEVTWDRLAEYVKRQVHRSVPPLIGDGAQQSPTLFAHLSGGSPVLMAASRGAVGGRGRLPREPMPRPSRLPKQSGGAIEKEGAGDAERPRAKALTNSIGMKLVLIPRGRFRMGAPADEEGRKKDEPLHEVEISKPFYLGAYTVTQRQYREIMGRNPSWFSRDGERKGRVKGLNTDDFPVEYVSWNEAVEFCRKLAELPAEKKAGRVYRLPTEAEWEYTCRAGTTTPFHFGKTIADDQANFGFKVDRPTVVGSYKPNAWGLYDMHGNVWQWCSDWYDKNHYKDSPAKDPQGPDRGTFRVRRGGSWCNNAASCRSVCRSYGRPDHRHYAIGFRVVCVPVK